MNIFLDATTSLMILRAAAANEGIELAPTDVHHPEPLSDKPVKLWKLGIPELLAFLRVPSERPLGIMVPRAADRVRTKGIRCTVSAPSSRDSTYLRLGPSGSDGACALAPCEAAVFVLSPENIVLHMAQRLRRHELLGKLTHHQAVLMLVKLCLELCGTYAHDPFRPNAGDVQYDLAPRLTKQGLLEFLQPAGTEQGLALAREASALVYDHSGSPQESYMGPALFFDSHLGGLDLCDFEANAPLNLNYNDKKAIGFRTITPDFTLARYNSVVEYLGSVHNEADNPRIDHRRSLDYQTLGLREFNFWYEDVDTLPHLMTSAARLVNVIEQFDGPAARKRFARLCNDRSFRQRQQLLASVFRPWLRGSRETRQA